MLLVEYLVIPRLPMRAGVDAHIGFANIADFAYEYVDSTATVGKEYYYKIRCVMKYGDGYKYTPYSGAIKVKIK